MNRKLYVGNLPYEVTEDDLQGLFGDVGAVASINVMRDRETGRARGFAFVEMASEADAQNAIDKLHDRPFGGLHFLEDSFEALLEFASILCSRN